ncbi:MAG: OmpH family outer membrane protein [Acidobacteria bacterium]|nr:OmpH family outer membrane protein [Acidobacteriota bacterium]
MKFVIAVSTTCLMLVAGPVAAQTPAKPGAAAPATTQPAPARPAPAQPAMTQPAMTQPASPPRPFPEGARIAYVDLNGIATQSREGQAAGAKIKEFQAKKQSDLEGRQKQLQAAQQKLEQGGSVLSDAARGGQQKEVERLQVELQRATQDAQQEVQEFTQELQVTFQQRLLPIIEQVAKAKNLQFILSIADAGVVWVDSGLNVTADVVTALDAATAPAAK